LSRASCAANLSTSYSCAVADSAPQSRGLEYVFAVTVLNTWRPLGADGAESNELNAFVQCEACLPARAMAGSADSLAAHGWRFPDLLKGPHLCPSCTYRGFDGEQRMRRSAPSERPALPNLLIIGATRAGTTALHTYLSLHPAIRMSDEKELDFFYDPTCDERLDEYTSFFDASAPVRGESSPRYTYAPRLPGVPQRIRAAIPDVKLIYLVRDPVERALSHYVYYSALWGEVPLGDAFAYPEDPYHLYTGPSRYAYQLELYLETFPREQIKVLDHADLLADARGTMRAVFRFLDVDDEFESPRFGERVNPAESRRRMTGAGRWLRASRLSETLGRVPARPRELLLRSARRVMSRPARTSAQPSAELRERLGATFADDVARLRELTGLELEAWHV
jgi:hypothetical protein